MCEEGQGHRSGGRELPRYCDYGEKGGSLSHDMQSGSPLQFCTGYLQVRHFRGRCIHQIGELKFLLSVQ